MEEVETGLGSALANCFEDAGLIARWTLWNQLRFEFMATRMNFIGFLSKDESFGCREWCFDSWGRLGFLSAQDDCQSSFDCWFVGSLGQFDLCNYSLVSIGLFKSKFYLFIYAHFHTLNAYLLLLFNQHFIIIIIFNFTD